MIVLAWLVAIAAIGIAVACAISARRASRRQRNAQALVAAYRIAEEGLRERLTSLETDYRHLHAILEALDDAVMVIGPHEEILSVNDAALMLFPTSLATVRGRTVIEVTGDHEIAQLVRHSRAGRTRAEASIELSSSGRVLRVIAVPSDGGDGDTLLLARDITQVQHLQSVRRELVANVSHELRTPLASIKVYVETLLEGGLDVPGMAEDRLNKINREVDELTQLVRELLDLARLESGRDQPHLVPLEAAEIGRNAAERLEAQAERAGVAIVLQFPPDLPRLRGDRRMLEGALVNLIHNAVKFTQAGGQVSVGALLAAGGQVTLYVEDTGRGIPAEHLPRLFERFYKQDPARTGGGTGLGLAIVKHVAIVHGGTVSVTSTVGRGSRFSIALPPAEARVPAELSAQRV